MVEERGHGRPAKKAKEPTLEEKPVNLATEMKGIHQTLNTLVELLAQQRRDEPQPHAELAPPVRGHRQP